MEEYKKFWMNFVNFSGRATRREYWLPVLFNAVISSILAYISPTLSSIFSCIYLIPFIAISIRRMHDINKSGWWLFIALIPIIGFIWYLVLLCTATVEEGNQYPNDAV